MPAIVWLCKKWTNNATTPPSNGWYELTVKVRYECDAVVSGEAKPIENNPSQVHMGAFFDTNIAIINLEAKHKYTQHLIFPSPIIENIINKPLKSFVFHSIGKP